VIALFQQDICNLPQTWTTLILETKDLITMDGEPKDISPSASVKSLLSRFESATALKRNTDPKEKPSISENSVKRLSATFTSNEVKKENEPNTPTQKNVGRLPASFLAGFNPKGESKGQEPSPSTTQERKPLVRSNSNVSQLASKMVFNPQMLMGGPPKKKVVEVEPVAEENKENAVQEGAIQEQKIEAPASEDIKEIKEEEIKAEVNEEPKEETKAEESVAVEPASPADSEKPGLRKLGSFKKPSIATERRKRDSKSLDMAWAEQLRENTICVKSPEVL
jgi:hypothetical protein